MADLALSILVTGGTLDDLELHDPDNGLVVVRYDLFAGESWEHRSAKSDVVHGSLRTGGAMNDATSDFHLRVAGGSVAAWKARRDALFAAFRQFPYVVEVRVDGVLVDRLDDCWPAERRLVGFGGKQGYTPVGLAAPGGPTLEYQFTVTHSPVNGA